MSTSSVTNTFAIRVDLCYSGMDASPVNSSQAKRYLAQRGCTFRSGRSWHLLVLRGTRTTVLPQHGSRKEIGKGLWRKILKDLDLAGETE